MEKPKERKIKKKTKMKKGQGQETKFVTDDIGQDKKNITFPGSSKKAARHPSRTSLRRITDLEMKLVYTNEEDNAYEVDEMNLSLESMCQSFKKICSLTGGDSSSYFKTDKRVEMVLKEAIICYKKNKYSNAVEHFTTALEMCHKDAAFGLPVEGDVKNISSVVSFIDSKLITCYLQIHQPDLALSHAHRSIVSNPSNFRNHIRQAAVFRLLERYSEAARSAMIADYIYWLSGGKEQSISQLIKLYWQAMHEKAMASMKRCSAIYTPMEKLQLEGMEKAKRHPVSAKFMYTDSQTFHLLPQSTDWSSASPQYLLTLGFRYKKDGFFLEKQSTKSLLVFLEKKNTFLHVSNEEIKFYLEILEKEIMPVLDFIKCTNLTSTVSPCSGAIQKLQYASFLSQLRRVKEESQVINQALAELATLPYLQEISQQHAELLQSLMADAMDCLQGRGVKEYTWNEIQKTVVHIMGSSQFLYSKTRSDLICSSCEMNTVRYSLVEYYPTGHQMNTKAILWCSLERLECFSGLQYYFTDLIW
uniref:Spermatosis associated 16 n=1 Tax=Leptobrachium leishanense TaxID=445787 RepID=A0A8C5WJ36_9ANUR